MKKLNKIIEYLFYFFLFLLPWQTRLILKEGILNQGHWEWGTYSLYLVDIVFVILFLLVCLERLIQKKSQIDRGAGVPIKVGTANLKSQNKLLLVVGCWLLVVFISIFWAKNPRLALYWALRILQGVILFFLIQKIDFDFIKAGFALVFAGLIQAFLGIYQFITQKVFASKWLGIAAQDPAQAGVSVIEVGGGRLLRIYGSFSHPNILAGFLVFIVFFAFLIYFLTKKSWQKYFFLFCTSLIIIALLLTYSRAALISLIFIIFLFGLLSLKKKLANFRTPFFEFFGLVLIAALIFVGFFVSDLMVRAQIKGRLEKISINERILGFQKGEEIIKENFLFGVGPGNYTFALYQKYPNFSSWNYQPVPNIYLLVLAELGILGFPLFLLIIIFTFYCLKFSAKGGSASGGIVYSLPLTSLLVLGLFDHWLFSLSFGIILFWLVVGLSKVVKIYEP